MKLFLAFAVWVIMGLLIGGGLLLSVSGHSSGPWILLASVLGFIVAVGKIGCTTH